ncbi:hypothetical protein [Mycobacterium lacus]|uniref:Uncharacterized protein n=1 Tax=Mycobacterium lacus TaxID=169765 RepID=A0A1X1Y3W5_9MYCO|nr:hypothetical protein [Mycobacterium lacus]MCV7125368.1 hypothetical protein [Mycobacterium lacus]ORW05711.1 hypothetical protein AWC15_01425 [Mycobacterium lacus]BBX99313.1 hypothetical protein MLAC_46070 [Mycobacterium lacus]
MAYTGRDAGDPGCRAQPAGDAAIENAVNVPGLVAAAVWAVALAVGLVAMIAGHLAVAAVALVFGVMAPWFGLAWISHSRREPSRAELWCPAASDAAAWFPTAWRRLRFTAR